MPFRIGLPHRIHIGLPHRIHIELLRRIHIELLRRKPRNNRTWCSLLIRPCLCLIRSGPAAGEEAEAAGARVVVEVRVAEAQVGAERVEGEAKAVPVAQAGPVEQEVAAKVVAAAPAERVGVRVAVTVAAE
jgi:hypothetical protein